MSHLQNVPVNQVAPMKDRNTLRSTWRRTGSQAEGATRAEAWDSDGLAKLHPGPHRPLGHSRHGGSEAEEQRDGDVWPP